MIFININNMWKFIEEFIFDYFFLNHYIFNSFFVISVDKPKPTGNWISFILGIAPSAP